ncbi:plastocyanin, chloroplast precursor [Micromonas commoda]|uniref:Plastocyanin n=1 Tax=Micromonas commoda (strain RCC299 / NOUM17 / CCMP2709) TaxID=296587 RepID=C1EB66_MICCC|nr:plastocyanin, chloroplast precursor [Micromonas commoda]ACO65330.1 plastocyanin, chloroplast precursor [Micromonas commoda]|eukprot:XP_002504072.1 plastocyanin, chloroplast precursor [Micromonas commoda]
MAAMTSTFLGSAVAAKAPVKVAAKKAVAPVASLDGLKKSFIANVVPSPAPLLPSQAAVVGVSTVLLASPAFAATIKLGGDNGELGFFPNKITVAKGETVEFVNNKAFPHNVVFDEDNVPSGVNADAISHEDYLNGPGEKVTNKFDTPGTYGYYCEPHQGAGMQGTIIVQ